MRSIDPIAGGFLCRSCWKIIVQDFQPKNACFQGLCSLYWRYVIWFLRWLPTVKAQCFFFQFWLFNLHVCCFVFWSFLAAETLASASLGLLRWTQPSGPGALGGPLVDLCNTVWGRVKTYKITWVWVNTYRYIFSGMNIHLPAILVFTRYQGFDPSPHEITIVGE